MKLTLKKEIKPPVFNLYHDYKVYNSKIDFDFKKNSKVKNNSSKKKKIQIPIIPTPKKVKESKAIIYTYPLKGFDSLKRYFNHLDLKPYNEIEEEIKIYNCARYIGPLIEEDLSNNKNISDNELFAIVIEKLLLTPILDHNRKIYTYSYDNQTYYIHKKYLFECIKIAIKGLRIKYSSSI